ncbi:MAG TPA: MlaD family protein [Candidatus Omnitrophota bacterium]|nr:MlaD family protein [Candidatus Omnitrophota bacterium]
MKRQVRLEITVGLFVIVALVILTFLVFVVSGVYLFRHGYQVNVAFSFVSNLDRGATVRLAGIPVGVVDDIEIYYPEGSARPKVKVKVYIKDRKIRFRQDSKIRIEGIYGLNIPHLEITPGESLDSGVVNEGDFITGVDPIPLESLVTKGREISEHLQRTVVQINSFLDDPVVFNSLKETIVNLDSLTASMNKILQDKEQDIRSVVEEIQGVTSALQSILQKIDRGQGTAGKLLTDDGLYNELEAFVQDLKKHPWKLLKKGKDDEDSSGSRKKWLGIF